MWANCACLLYNELSLIAWPPFLGQSQFFVYHLYPGGRRELKACLLPPPLFLWVFCGVGESKFVERQVGSDCSLTSCMFCAFPFWINQPLCNFLSFFCQSLLHSVHECWFYIVVTIQWTSCSHPIWAFIDYIRLPLTRIPPHCNGFVSSEWLGSESLFSTVLHVNISLILPRVVTSHVRLPSI